MMKGINMDFPKSVRIKLTPSQKKQLEKLFAYAEFRYLEEERGIIFAQPKEMEGKFSIMDVGFIEHKYAMEFLKLSEMAREENQITTW